MTGEGLLWMLLALSLVAGMLVFEPIRNGWTLALVSAIYVFGGSR